MDETFSYIRSPQEFATQMAEAYPQYENMPEDHANRLSQHAAILKAEVEGLQPSQMNDEELLAKLEDIRTRASESGAWEGHKGDGADERLQFNVERHKGFGYNEEEAAIQGLNQLQRDGFLDAIKYNRRQQEQLFEEPTTGYVDAHPIDVASEKQAVDALLERTVDIATIDQAERTKLARDFPSGNFLYHGTGTEQLVKILDSGVLANNAALRDREEAAAVVEGRESELVRHNSGFEGISWSMNGIDALPGDRYHLAGFVAAPEKALDGEYQLAVPSRPSPNEVILLDGDIDAPKYYAAKTQYELYNGYNRNSVLGGILNATLEHEKDDSDLLAFAPRLKQDESLAKSLEDGYTIAADGSISFSPDLLSSDNPDEELPVAAYWLDALVKSGRFKGTEFDGLDTAGVITSITEENSEQILYKELRRDADPWQQIVESKEMNPIEVPVESMYFVAPRKDADAWLKVIARSEHQPLGILLYDDNRVRLENFASLHRGDHNELTAELQTAISPDNQDYISYARVLGTEFTNDMRTGHRRQVIAEGHLANRKAIKKVGNELIVSGEDALEHTEIAGSASLEARLELPRDLIISGKESANIESAGSTIYPIEPAQQGMELGFEGVQSSEDARDYAAKILSKDKSTDLTVLSDRWSSSIVLEDSPSKTGLESQKVYKVYRSADNYTYVEGEMANLTLLHAHDLAPKPYLLIDADDPYRSSRAAPTEDIAGIQIARQNCGGPLPIIVMDKVNAAPIESMPDAQLSTEFNRVMRVARELKLAVGDTELVYDTDKRHVTFIDVAGISRLDDSRITRVNSNGQEEHMDWLMGMRQEYPGYSDEEIIAARITTDVLNHFLSDRQVSPELHKMQTFLNIFRSTGDIERGLEWVSTNGLIYNMRNMQSIIREALPNHWQPS